MTEQERTQGIGAADFHWPYPMEGGYDSSAGHVYAQAIRGANEMRHEAWFEWSISLGGLGIHGIGAGGRELKRGCPAAFSHR